MKAAVIHAQGGPEVLSYEDVADAVPGPDDVVIAVGRSASKAATCSIAASSR
jgi:NADPH:quinone reductase-like Zn-dependent oxidoreductase